MTRRLAALLTILALAPSACSIGSDDSPRTIGADQRTELQLGNGQQGGAATGAARIYLVAPDEPGQSRKLQPVARDVDETAQSLLAALFQGPNDDERDAQLRTALPADAHLLGTRLQSGVLVVDVSNELQLLSGDSLVTAVAQIVLTASEAGVDRIRIVVDGTAQQWPAGNGELKSEPLTPYDFPGLVVSAQPSYPPLPSPTAVSTA